MDFSGLDVGLRRVREEQADLHAPARAAIDLCFVTARSCPAIADASRDPRDPSFDIVRWILRCGMIGHSGPARSRPPTAVRLALPTGTADQRATNRSVGALPRRSFDRTSAVRAYSARRRSLAGGPGPRSASVFRGSTRRPLSPRTW